MTKIAKKPPKKNSRRVSDCTCLCCRRHARKSKTSGSRWGQALGETSLTNKEVAQHLGVHPAQISQWMKAGTVPDPHKADFAVLVGKDLNWLMEYMSKNNSFNSRYREFMSNWRAFIRPKDIITCELCEDKFKQSRNREIHKITTSKDPLDVIFLCGPCLLRGHI